MSEKINYRKLFKAYMIGVIEAEGVSFLSNIIIDYPKITDEEIKWCEDIAKEVEEEEDDK